MNSPREHLIDDDDMRDSQRRARDRWHVGKEIPIAVLMMLAIQTSGGVWWAASLSSKLDSVIAQVAEIRQERYTKDDARRDMELMRTRDAELERRLNAIEQRRS